MTPNSVTELYSNTNDMTELQKDINELVEWAHKWQMNFNIDKGR